MVTSVAVVLVLVVTSVVVVLVQMERMDKSLESVKRSFATVRTGRANPAMLDRIEVLFGYRSGD